MRVYAFVGLAASLALCPAFASAGDDGLGFEPALSAGGLYSDSGSSGGLSLGSESLEVEATSISSPAVGLASVVAPLSLGEAGKKSGSYVTARIGPLFFLDDLEDLDVGLNFEVGFGYNILPFLALEFDSGYLWGEIDNGDYDLWGIPFVVNLKLTIPIAILEIYGGVGVGGYYFETDRIFGSDESDVVFGGNAFLGVGFKLGPVALGVEAKYILTDEFDAAGSGGDDPQFEGIAAMVFASFGF